MHRQLREARVVRLEDVARVVRGHKEREVITRIDGRESVEIAIYKEGGTNTVTVADARHASASTRCASGSQRIGRRPRARRSSPTRRATSASRSPRCCRPRSSAAAWPILVLLLFLRNFKTTVIIGVSIPISVVGAFFLMYVSGISLNIMSLGGLTLGIGLLVDNSIVVLESIQRQRDEGLGRRSRRRRTGRARSARR